jgi:hypothetical protein
MKKQRKKDTNEEKSEIIEDILEYEDRSREEKIFGEYDVK